MGYALFTARKLSLTARVNNLNAQLMTISNQRDALTQQITQKQNAANLRNAQANANAASVYAEALKAGKGQEDFDSSEAEATYNQTVADNNIDNTIDNIEIQALQSRDNILDTTQKSIQTRLTAAQKELEAVEKAEESAIGNATPKYAG